MQLSQNEDTMRTMQATLQMNAGKKYFQIVPRKSHTRFICLISVFACIEALRTAQIRIVTMRNDRDIALDKAKFAIKCRNTACEERNTEIDAHIRADDRRTELIGVCCQAMRMCMTKASLHSILQQDIFLCELHLNCFAHLQASIVVSTGRFRIPRSC